MAYTLNCSLFITFLLHLSQEVVVEGQDKVFKDVIEPLENVSVTVIPTAKENIRDFGPPNEVAETLIKKVLAPPSQKTKLIAASEREVEGTAYYTFEFVAQALNYTRHVSAQYALAMFPGSSTLTVPTRGGGIRWKERLQTVVTFKFPMYEGPRIHSNSSFEISDTSEISISNEERRRRLYDKMARSLDENGAQFLQNGETSQSLSLSDLFQLKDGRVTPVLKVVQVLPFILSGDMIEFVGYSSGINPPVRANVLHLAPEHAIPIMSPLRKTNHVNVFYTENRFDKAIWFQNTTLYHFSMFHASHHVIPVSATEEEIESEAKAVENVAKELVH
ncbi:hypothetical protein Leryth_016377 [Lithospermum erythrorhizon]|nr:hypothetical protein Leryth_016377 [Lithospermum erythrorhizon]